MSQELLGDIVLALTLAEFEDGDRLATGEILEGRDEVFGDGIHESAGGELVAAMKAEEVDDALFALQRRDVDVEIHAVDSLDFEGDVLGEDVGNGRRW